MIAVIIGGKAQVDETCRGYEMSFKKFFTGLLAASVLLMNSGCAASKDADLNLAARDVSTLAVRANLVVSDTLPEKVVYDIVSVIFGDTSIFGIYSDTMNIENASSVEGVPYHPGAASYYEENGCSVAETSSETNTEEEYVPEITIATGDISGMYYNIGIALSQALQGATGIVVNVISTSGSKANLEAIADGTADIGFVQADILHYAVNGEKVFEGSPMTGFSEAAALYVEALQIVTTDPDIASVADLRGKKVSIGEEGSGVYYNALDVLEAYGIGGDDIELSYQGFKDEAESLYDGSLDAVFVVAGYPTEAVSELALKESIYLVPVEGAECDALIASTPYYETIVIPAGTY